MIAFDAKVEQSIDFKAMKQNIYCGVCMTYHDTDNDLVVIKISR